MLPHANAKQLMASFHAVNLNFYAEPSVKPYGTFNEQLGIPTAL
jgi:hypothetical protein